MPRFAATTIACAALVVMTWGSVSATGSPQTAATPTAAVRTSHTCAAAQAGFARCDAQLVISGSATPNSTGTTKPRGYGPADIRSAYALSATAGKNKTVAIVSAFNDPAAESDLAVYRKRFGLPACLTANGCFRKVNQAGGRTMPRVDSGWATETSLDLDMVSATCASCKILLVQARNDSMANLGAAVNYAATQKVSAISNSYSSRDPSQAAAYDHPGIAITASTGDDGYGVGAPATYATVIAVGGTTLKRSTDSRHWIESAWSGAGSGCSKRNPKPRWQSTTTTQCSGKAVADVSAVADPATGVAVYDSTRFSGAAGWLVFGGTSASAPIIAAVYAMSGNTKGYPASYTWSHRAALNDITTGANGTCTKISARWCKATKGWDGPTGLGTPHGTRSF
jgi:subtilase family serine protease